MINCASVFNSINFQCYSKNNLIFQLVWTVTSQIQSQRFTKQTLLNVFHWKTVSHLTPLLHGSVISFNLTGLLLHLCPYHFNALQCVSKHVGVFKFYWLTDDVFLWLCTHMCRHQHKWLGKITISDNMSWSDRYK